MDIKIINEQEVPVNVNAHHHGGTHSTK